MNRKKLWFGFAASFVAMLTAIVIGAQSQKFDWTMASVSIIMCLVMSGFVDHLLEGDLK